MEQTKADTEMQMSHRSEQIQEMLPRIYKLFQILDADASGESARACSDYPLYSVRGYRHSNFHTSAVQFGLKHCIEACLG